MKTLGPWCLTFTWPFLGKILNLPEGHYLPCQSMINQIHSVVFNLFQNGGIGVLNLVIWVKVSPNIHAMEREKHLLCFFSFKFFHKSTCVCKMTKELDTIWSNKKKVWILWVFFPSTRLVKSAGGQTQERRNNQHVQKTSRYHMHYIYHYLSFPWPDSLRSMCSSLLQMKKQLLRVQSSIPGWTKSFINGELVSKPGLLFPPTHSAVVVKARMAISCSSDWKQHHVSEDTNKLLLLSVRLWSHFSYW